MTVELSPSRLAMVVRHRGRVVASATERHDAARFREDWGGAIAGLRAPLKAMAESLRAAGVPTTVVYSSPAAVCGVFACPVAAGRAAWERSARLAIAEAASFPVAENPADCTRIAEDAAAGAPGAGAPAHVHTLGVADTDSTLQTLADAVASAGLSPIGFVPVGAVALASAVTNALAHAAPGPATIVLHVDEHLSVLVLAAGGRMKLVRQLGFGTELLVEAFTRVLGGDPARSADTRNHARGLLLSVGIPDKEHVVDAERNLNGAAVLPALQPLLQRLLIEAKQSLRFGLTEGERVSPRLHLNGAGAGVPGLARLVADHVGATLEPAAVPTAAPHPDPDRLGVALVPSALRRRLQARAASRGLWTGGAAAALFIAYMAVASRTDLAVARERLAADRAALEAASDVRSMIDELAAARLGLADARRRIDAAFAGATDWGALLVAIADNTPETVELATVELAIDRNRPICRIRGQARSPGGGDPSVTVRAFLDRLTRLPIVAECRMGSTQRIGDDHDPRQAFNLTLTLLDLAPVLTAQEGGTP